MHQQGRQTAHQPPDASHRTAACCHTCCLPGPPLGHITATHHTRPHLSMARWHHVNSTRHQPLSTHRMAATAQCSFGTLKGACVHGCCCCCRQLARAALVRARTGTCISSHLTPWRLLSCCAHPCAVDDCVVVAGEHTPSGQAEVRCRRWPIAAVMRAMRNHHCMRMLLLLPRRWHASLASPQRRRRQRLAPMAARQQRSSSCT
jgi:hypothetical protein